MDILFNVLLITHLLALAVATAGAVTMPVIMPRMAGASPEGRQMLGGIGQRLRINGQIAFGVLLLTGIAMVFVRYGGFDAMGIWFWVKMGFIAIVLVMMIVGAVTKPGTIPVAVFAWVPRIALLGIFVSAVFAFN